MIRSLPGTNRNVDIAVENRFANENLLELLGAMARNPVKVPLCYPERVPEFVEVKRWSPA